MVDDQGNKNNLLKAVSYGKAIIAQGGPARGSGSHIGDLIRGIEHWAPCLTFLRLECMIR